MIEGSCHCGAVGWRFDGEPEDATACSCSICRRYGVLWAYDFEGERITISGETRRYAWGPQSIGFHACPTCGCLAYWRATEPRPSGQRRVAVNLRMANDPEQVAAVPVRHLDGAGDWRQWQDGRCVRDYWV